MATIETEKLTKVYGKDETAVIALNGVSLRIGQGKFVAIMGPSGCGKSTLLHLMGGLDRPTSGRVIVGENDIAQLNDKKLTELRRRKIGFVFQYYNLIPVLTARENAALPLILDGIKQPEAHERAAEWLARMGLKDRINHRPDQLSGGQQQRVAIARALVTEPALILADEPTGNLDTRASDEIAHLLHRISEQWNRTVVMVTHDPRISAHADKIIFLKDGSIVDETQLSHDDDETDIVRERMEEL
ncbi:MAG TPA: ABC transporter ATP-binding protein [Anaerolineae bacterium]|nr:ABC transporter ATP-binding protein [Anaerolineae bacterium]